MSELLLSSAERERFAAYLEREAQTDETLIEQMKKIGVPEAVQKRLFTEAMAARIVARKLRSTESVTVASPQDPLP